MGPGSFLSQLRKCTNADQQPTTQRVRLIEPGERVDAFLQGAGRITAIQRNLGHQCVGKAVGQHVWTTTPDAHAAPPILCQRAADPCSCSSRAHVSLGLCPASNMSDLSWINSPSPNCSIAGSQSLWRPSDAPRMASPISSSPEQGRRPPSHRQHALEPDLVVSQISQMAEIRLCTRIALCR
jgi:hypothetical protein